MHARAVSGDHLRADLLLPVGLLPCLLCCSLQTLLPGRLLQPQMRRQRVLSRRLLPRRLLPGGLLLLLLRGVPRGLLRLLLRALLLLRLRLLLLALCPALRVQMPFDNLRQSRGQ